MNRPPILHFWLPVLSDSVTDYALKNFDLENMAVFMLLAILEAEIHLYDLCSVSCVRITMQGCFEIVEKCINNQQFRKQFQSCFLYKCLNNFAAGSCSCEQLCSIVLWFESGQSYFFAFLSCFKPPICPQIVSLLPIERRETIWGPILVLLESPFPISYTCSLKLFQYLERFSYKSTEHSKKLRFSSEVSIRV